MYTFLLIVHFIVCLLLILIVLLQVGKSFGLSGLMGGGTSDAIVTTSSGNEILKKITMILAVLFMVTSFSLTFVTSKKLNVSSLSDIMPPTPTIPNIDPRAEKGSLLDGNENIDINSSTSTSSSGQN